jgi:hypothetical protein
MKPGKSLELDVRRIYNYLLNMRDEGVVVGHDVSVIGKSGVRHQVDVYYEFKRAGISHRVAIECKDWTNPVSKGQVQEFESKVRDIGNVVGLMVSRVGYQSGALDLAKFYGIMALQFDELPSFPALMAERITTVAIPDEDAVGEPFWLIMEIRDGKGTGSHYATSFPGTRERIIPLFFSKPHAERAFEEGNLSKSLWAVRGLPRYALRAFLAALELYEKKMAAAAGIFFLPPGARPDAQWIMIKTSRDDLVREYYGSKIPSINPNGSE